jgi:hypothetical protein
MAAEPQKLCGILLANKDAVIRVKLDNPLAADESARFTLVLQDLYRAADLVAIAEATLEAGGATSVDLPVQSTAAGLSLAYAGDSFARVALRWSGSVGSPANAKAQLVIAGASHSFPMLAFTIPKTPPPDPPSLVWILGRGLTGLDAAIRG